jgi:hypothetical protein
VHNALVVVLEFPHTLARFFTLGRLDGKRIVLRRVTQVDLARRVGRSVDHPERKLLRIAKERFVLQGVDDILLLMQMLSSLLKVLLLLKDTEPERE